MCKGTTSRLPAMTTERPDPVIDDINAFFWNATARGELVVQRCLVCEHLRSPPALACPRCWSLQWAEERMDGRGSVYSYAIPRRPSVPFLGDRVALVVVELDEGVRMMSNLVGLEADEITIGMRVEAFFAPSPSGAVLPLFQRSGG